MKVEAAGVDPQMAQMAQMRRCLKASKTGRQSDPEGQERFAGKVFDICAICVICG